MGDQAAVQPAPAAPAAAAAVPTLEDRQIAASRARDEARQSRRASAVAKINASHAAAAETASQVAAVAPAATPARPAPAPAAVKPVEAPKPAEAKTVELAKPTEPTVDDAAAQRGLAQIEHARKRFLDERASKEEEFTRREQRLAQRENELNGHVKSIDELKKLDLSSLLDKLGLDDAKLTQLSRESYYRTSEGQKNPSAKAAVEEVRQRTTLSSIEERFAEMEKSFDDRVEKRAQEIAWKVQQQASYANEWTDGAMKEVPADKPTLFAKLQAKDSRAARSALQALGADIEKTTGATPSAAEVLTEYEKRQRSYLESQGIDVEMLLAPAPAKPAAEAATKPIARTLDAGGPTQITRPDAVPNTREERRANAVAKLRMRQRTTADQVQ